MSKMTDNLWTIKQEEFDPLAVRISVGMPHEVIGHPDGEVGYVVVRGDLRQALHIMEQATEQLRQAIEGAEA